MRSFFLAAALIVCVAGLATEDAEKEVKKTRKHHSKHHNKHHGEHHGKHHHHHHHHHGKHHKGSSEHDVAHADAKHAKDVAKITPEQIRDAFQTSWSDKKKPVEKKAVETTNAAKKAGAVSHVITKGKTPATTAKGKESEEDTIVKHMKELEAKLQKKKVEKVGQILVNGPIPADFKERFAQAVAAATGASALKVKVTKTKPQEGGIVAVPL